MVIWCGQYGIFWSLALALMIHPKLALLMRYLGI